jgi:geranylgeranylglycerol-phosphate geranylgeranyltransferase
LVLIGAWLAGGWPLPWQAWQAAVAMWCVTAFGYASNDYFDIREDRVNKPDRPIPAGAVSANFTVYLSLALALSALGVSAQLGWLEFGVALAVLALLTLYNLRLKSTPGGGNVLIAMLAGCTLLAGSVAVRGIGWSALQAVWAPAATLACFIATREVLKTLEDIAGDQAAGKQTLAVRLGDKGVLRLSAGLSGLTILLGLVPVVWLKYSITYLTVMTAGVFFPLVWTVQALWQQGTPSQVSRCLAVLKGSYFAGILALLLA